MENKLFREKSLAQISSPEDLHDYMRVTGPRLWMLLSAVFVLLVGFVVYASTATMENIVPIRLRAFNISYTDTTGDASEDVRVCVFTAKLPQSYQGILKPGMEVRLGRERGKVEYFSLEELGSMFEDEDQAKGQIPASAADLQAAGAGSAQSAADGQSGADGQTPADAAESGQASEDSQASAEGAANGQVPADGSAADGQSGAAGNTGISVFITMNNSHFSIPDGYYDAELVLESTTPISFLWN